MIYKCGSCGSCMEWDYRKKQLVCLSCGNTDNVEVNDRPIEHSVCPNCGGIVKITDNILSTKCEYCDSYIINENASTTPVKIAPSRINKKEVFRILSDAYSKYICLVSDVFSEERLKEVTIEYKPYYLAEAKGKIHAVGDIEASEVEGNTCHHTDGHIDQTIKVSFHNMLIPANKDLSDDIVYQLAPFEVDRLEPLSIDMLSGSYSSTPDISDTKFASDFRMEAELATQNNLVDYFKEYVRGFDSMDLGRLDVRLDLETIKKTPVLLPIFVYKYKLDNGDEYIYYLNGQTKEIVGKPPISKSRLVKYKISILIRLLAISFLVLTVIGTMGLFL